VQERDRRLAFIIIGILLLIPVIWTVMTVVIQQIIEFFM
jgi:hypothetical protein